MLLEAARKPGERVRHSDFRRSTAIALPESFLDTIPVCLANFGQNPRISPENLRFVRGLPHGLRPHTQVFAEIGSNLPFPQFTSRHFRATLRHLSVSVNASDKCGAHGEGRLA